LNFWILQTFGEFIQELRDKRNSFMELVFFNIFYAETFNQKREQQDAINSDLFNQLYLNMFRAPLRPSSGQLTVLELLHMVSSTGYCWLWSWRVGGKPCALWRGCCSTVLSNIQQSTLLMMGVKAPETC
jgi:hypothetical protein